ncbi:hypothetical protein FGO68_gene1772 [Halteria grandinella]|uniref:Uncharacterized protein n=1 Tax=Halteria grandinella TaxID=5974 RepID=A0A8J8T5N1_HALGN|nr:hypothetical protein FGO68_gene1772 [Halteria grandinella]
MPHLCHWLNFRFDSILIQPLSFQMLQRISHGLMSRGIAQNSEALLKDPPSEKCPTLLCPLGAHNSVGTSI